ncbi:hypothetical protein CfE428DRAFT_3034 [Chthoniobacter flavus Ellin428]|uniref:SseB protein N-terminal domain-containing protein n=1 Tax=Chthoniobacter flavus Ellin428 TaxID=497964 RepID=B4D2A9_9BACT|nr:SseB family protein [Chthoniobacter flavus]EDY19349.1 hypothetical protein CfE428DRAFT_3034 [Chthoniobacter flavus Ellin428]TCO90520.1 type III secretion system (T3SS) SseB-like protein [Chthoniobacter flavus]
MFGFLKKFKAQREAANARAQEFKEVVSALQAGHGNPLEGALVLHLTQDTQETFVQFVLFLGNSDVWMLNKTSERLGDPAMTQASDGNPYVAVFTSQERASAALSEWKLASRPSLISASELVFGLAPQMGIVINAHHPHLQWSFPPARIADVRTLFERSYSYEVGGIYSVWGRGGYQAIKLLNIEEGGVHVRMYANTWPERPASIDTAALMLAGADDPAFSIGHMPVVRSHFLSMGPRLVMIERVKDDELEGYRMWQEAKGGYFGTPTS